MAGPSGASAERALLDDVTRADVYLLIVREWYSTPGASGMSPTEEEFEEAQRWRNPILVMCQDVEMEPRQRQLLERAPRPTTPEGRFDGAGRYPNVWRTSQPPTSHDLGPAAPRVRRAYRGTPGRPAHERGTAPAVIAWWSAEVQAEQARAANDLQRARQAYAPPPSRDELQNLIREAGDLVAILANAEAADRRGLYAALGLRLTYEPDRRRVVVECRPDGERLCKSSCRRGDCDQTPKMVLRGALELL